MATARRKRQSREEKRGETRARLLRAARDVFGRRGYHGASLEEIAEEAGFSKGALYYNFAGKEELFLALLDERLRDRVEAIESAVEQEDAPEAGLREVGRRYVESLEENREWLLLYFEFWAHAVRQRRYAPQLSASLEALREGVASVIERHLGEARSPDETKRMAMMANALALGIAVEKHTDPEGVPDDLFGDALVRLFAVETASKRR